MKNIDKKRATVKKPLHYRAKFEAVRVNTTINSQIHSWGEALQRERGVAHWSELVSILIREDWERRHGPTPTPDAAPRAA